MIIRVIVDKRRSNKDGLFPIKLRISDRGKSVYESLGIYADTNEFDEKSGIFITGNRKNNAKNLQYNNLINSFVSRANDIIRDYRKAGKSLSPEKLKKLLLDEEKQTAKHNFNSYFRKFLSEKTGRTKDVYQTTLNKIENYFGKNIEFDEVDYTWLTNFNKRMKKEPVLDQKGNIKKYGIETNSRSIHFRNIRAIF